MGLPAYPVAAFSPGGNKAYAPARSTSIMTGVYGTNASDAVAYNIASVAQGSLIRSSKFGDTVTGLAKKANQERARRGSAQILVPAGYFTGVIDAGRIQDIRGLVEVEGPAATYAYNGTGQGTNTSDGKVSTGFQPGTVLVGYDSYYGGAVYGPGQVPAFGPAADPQVVTYPKAAAPTMSYSFASGDIITASDINQLITEINNAGAVCTCNCNYCTCNCNYCTCNCNYACTCNCNYSDEQVKSQIEYL